MSTAIAVEGLSKRYRLGQLGSGTFFRDFERWLARARGRPDPYARVGEARGAGEGGAEHWALRDVSFAVRQGEVLGIIGRNGAGKSTLLKILSRVTAPTAGVVKVRGRIASLLEVGTGFHPELTGRENLYLNGAILGMTRAEVRRKFDEIVAFAGVEPFIDTPVKRYSSGMYVRLAFAVAAHLEPEILVVDEVLAVGDAEFQKRCLGKMGEVAQGGRTVLFVSHQMNQIQRLTAQALWVDAGRVRAIGPTPLVVGQYELAARSAAGRAPDGRQPHGAAHFTGWGISGAGEFGPHVLATTGQVEVAFQLAVNEPVADAHVGVALYSAENQLMWANAVSKLALRPPSCELAVALPSLPLRPGVYRWLVSLYGPNGPVDLWSCTPDLMIVAEPVTHSDDAWQGVLNLPSTFDVRGKP